MVKSSGLKNCLNWVRHDRGLCSFLGPCSFLGIFQMTITSVQIIDMFQIAYDTDKKLPAVYKKGASSMRFDIVHDTTDHSRWSKQPIRLTASNKEIEILEFCLFYLNPLMSVEERKLVWARTYNAPWHWIGKNILNCTRHTAKKKYLGVIRMLRMKISINGELMKKLPRM